MRQGPIQGFDRRQLLYGVGAGSLLLWTCGARCFAQAARMSPDDPWNVAVIQRQSDIRLRTLSYAILAPNALNIQPWVAEIVGDDQLLIRCDLERRLPVSDPSDRQMGVSFGTFLGLMQIAAAGQGYAASLSLFPEGEPALAFDERPVASVRFRRSASAAGGDLFTHILERRSNKKPFQAGRSVPDTALTGIRSVALGVNHVEATNDPQRVAAIKDVARRAFLVESRTDRVLREMVDLTRLGSKAIEVSPDGEEVRGPGVDEAVASGNLTHAALLQAGSPAAASAQEKYLALIETGQAYIWVSTAGNTKHEQIQAGMNWVRLNLKATALGVALHPHSQALHDYREMLPLLAAMHSTLGVTSRRVQMLGRLGYGEVVPPAPRWPVETHLAHA